MGAHDSKQAKSNTNDFNQQQQQGFPSQPQQQQQQQGYAMQQGFPQPPQMYPQPMFSNQPILHFLQFFPQLFEVINKSKIERKN